MVAIESQLPANADRVSRRHFLRVGGLSVLGATTAEQHARGETAGKSSRRCILVLLNGGASQFETFDPKPGARGDIRGPYRPIATATAGLQLCETLPLLAQRSQKFAVLRSLYHDAAPIHETSLQLLQTGRLVQRDLTPPSLGSIVAHCLGTKNDWPAYAVLPRPLSDCGSPIRQGAGAGSLGASLDPWSVAGPCASEEPENRFAEAISRSDGGMQHSAMQREVVRRWLEQPDGERRIYGDSELARSCLAARRLVEQGTRFVTINMFDSLAERVTWDCHANNTWAPASVADYRSTLCPDLDRGVSALLDDLDQRGLLEETLVVVTGEFGRTPRMNDRGGRDHWTGVWSALLAGGGIAGGRTLGASDAQGTYPAERPTSPAELAATILQSLGIDADTRLPISPGGDIALADASPVQELFA
ncbi:MAG: DUF1501 domain-containing protein [Planctomycetaceae bacterium]|nr:DUF1501 domain-containing protein [Planctomycetaceae bacterium]